MPKNVWSDDYYIKSYELAREGLKDTAIARTLGVDKRTFKQWVNKRPSLRNALVKARAGGSGSLEKAKGGETFMDYVYRRLPPHVQDTWKDIRTSHKEKNPLKTAEDILGSQGKRTRQILFVHSLVCSNFNKAEACRKIGLPYITLDKWSRNDPDFIELLGYVQQMKKDFVEGALLSLVAQGDVTATIFASKCLNKDRGYDSKTVVTHEGTINHAHVNMGEVINSLPAETQRAVLDQMRRNNKMLPVHDEDVQDAEFEVSDEETIEEDADEKI